MQTTSIVVAETVVCRILEKKVRIIIFKKKIEMYKTSQFQQENKLEKEPKETNYHRTRIKGKRQWKLSANCFGWTKEVVRRSFLCSIFLSIGVESYVTS